MATTQYTVHDFVADARRIVAHGLDDDATIAAIAEPLERLISRSDCLADVEPGGNPDPDRGFDIFRDASLTVRAVVWAANGGAPPHNHNGWALEGVISGVERNRNYQRLDDGSEPWRARLEEVDPSVVTAGKTTSLALPPNDIHAVEIPAGKTLAIHVYGMDLWKQWRYRFNVETGEVLPFPNASVR
jgi:predicted metal-dependent enzyme (double-stranded beta helix superfamily)